MRSSQRWLTSAADSGHGSGRNCENSGNARLICKGNEVDVKPSYGAGRRCHFSCLSARKIYVECDRGGSRLPLQIVNTFVSNEMFYEIEKKNCSVFSNFLLVFLCPSKTTSSLTFANKGSHLSRQRACVCRCERLSGSR